MTACARPGAFLALLLLTPLSAQEAVDTRAIEILRREGLEHSQVMEHLSWLTDVHGPRLTGSPNLRRASQWALDSLASWGVANGHLEAWGPFGNGWHCDRFAVNVEGENAWPVHAYPKAWSPGFEQPVTGEVISFAGKTPEALRALRGKLGDKIVLLEGMRPVDEPFEGLATRFTDEDLLRMATGTTIRRSLDARRSSDDARNALQLRSLHLRFLQEEQPLAILDRSYKGDYGTIFVSSAAIGTPDGTPRGERPRPWEPGDTNVIPQFTLAVEHANRIQRLLDKGLPVRMRLELAVRFFTDNKMVDNVIAEIPGRDPEIGTELVMLGAHLDSWHAGTGSTDNGCGSAVMLEAMRLLTVLYKELGEGPRRTIRIGLWTGEEQGLHGSRNYVAKHLAERGERGQPPVKTFEAYDRFAGYFNLDNGTGRIRGVYLQGNEACAPIFRTWLRPFHDLDASVLTLNDTGGTDHLAFDGVGLPGFQFIQDPVGYDTRTHHSNMDNWDHAIAEDLQQAATIVAAFVHHTAMRDEKLPRKAWDATGR
ncbi:MAG: M28 family peptidase [Planctomycetes bacterium]|nr:M28 family peptidase [Planctomycetota bacterium]